jgi:lon-related putative ATP-dependent protease
MNRKKTRTHKELKPNELRWKCDPNVFEFTSTSDIEPLKGILGQKRALKALRLGVELKAPGYNIYIAGLSGSGKATTVKEILKTMASSCPEVFDYAYVNNFQDPDRPTLLVFPKGVAKFFVRALHSAIEVLRHKIMLALESDSYIGKKKSIVANYNKKEEKLMKTFDTKLRKEGLSLGQVKVGDVARPDIIPLIGDEQVPIFQLEQKVKDKVITQKQAKQITKMYKEYQEELKQLFKKGLKISQEFQKKLEDLEVECTVDVVKAVMENLRENFPQPKVQFYLSQVEENILDNIQIFKGSKPQGETTQEGYVIDYFREYEVNIILDNSTTIECPIIAETSPTFTNLFGSVERVSDGKGNFYSDFTNIKAGSILRANGGYLVLNVMHLFEETSVWKTLKRVLTYHTLEIQDSPNLFHFTSSTVKPEPIELDVKVILIGSQAVYSYLSEYEYDFKKMFKVKADFDYEMTQTNTVLREYAQLIKKLIKDDKLKEFDKNAIAHLLEIAAIYAGQKNKLTARFSKIADLAREANFWANDDKADIVTAKHIEMAYQNAIERHGMLESKISEMYEDKSFLMDVTGERCGQINGLAIYSADYYSFGRPTRITATVSLGSGNIINVEREAGMSGRHYNKGVLIISGYFKETFGQQLPLSFNANLVFEQSYGTVDGDSASCAEIFALLSTLSGLPIKQSIAVTGSLNQKGDVQPIGGVNEKVEGFFDVCKSMGLNKKQGVIIPAQNVKDLMLRDDVIEAVGKKEFHIYTIERVEEGIEILTGISAGKKTIKGYTKGSVFSLVEEKIKDMYAIARTMKKQSTVGGKKKKK